MDPEDQDAAPAAAARGETAKTLLEAQRLALWQSNNHDDADEDGDFGEDDAPLQTEEEALLAMAVSQSQLPSQQKIAARTHPPQSQIAVPTHVDVSALSLKVEDEGQTLPPLPEEMTDEHLLCWTNFLEKHIHLIHRFTGDHIYDTLPHVIQNLKELWRYCREGSTTKKPSFFKNQVFEVLPEIVNITSLVMDKFITSQQPYVDINTSIPAPWHVDRKEFNPCMLAVRLFSHKLITWLKVNQVIEGEQGFLPFTGRKNKFSGMNARVFYKLFMGEYVFSLVLGTGGGAVNMYPGLLDYPTASLRFLPEEPGLLHEERLVDSCGLIATYSQQKNLLKIRWYAGAAPLAHLNLHPFEFSKTALSLMDEENEDSSLLSFLKKFFGIGVSAQSGNFSASNSSTGEEIFFPLSYPRAHESSVMNLFILEDLKAAADEAHQTGKPLSAKTARMIAWLEAETGQTLDATIHQETENLQAQLVQPEIDDIEAAYQAKIHAEQEARSKCSKLAV